MNTQRIIGAALAGTFGLLATTSLAHAMPSKEEMWRMIQAQQQQIESLKSAVEKTDQKVEATASSVEQVRKVSLEGESGYGGSHGWFNNTSVGGYGEMHFNSGSSTDSIDFHRYVLFVNHEFNDWMRLYSELELEHALSGDGKPGEVELEQAYIEFDLSETQHAKAGLFLIPVGILNENHEPPTFFGVERNPVEKNIIPTTWWEGGVGLNGELGEGFSYDVAVTSGLSTPTSGSSAFKVRNGRQKVASATAEDGAFTGRLKWTGYPGVELAATGQYQSDVTQNGFTEEVSATLFETHADLRHGGWGLRALYARWDLDGDAPELIGRDEQVGWYVEPSYRFDTQIGEWGVFARYNQYDNNAGNNTDTEYEQVDVGLNYWPHRDVVLKADVAFLDNPAGTEDDEIINLGVGFQF